MIEPLWDYGEPHPVCYRDHGDGRALFAARTLRVLELNLQSALEAQGITPLAVQVARGEPGSESCVRIDVRGEATARALQRAVRAGRGRLIVRSVVLRVNGAPRAAWADGTWRVCFDVRADLS